MSLQSKTGTFTIQSTDTGDLSEVNVGFQPDVILFWWGGASGSSPQLAGGDVNAGVGCAASASSRWVVSSSIDDNVGTTNATYVKRADAIVATGADGDVTGLADIASISSNGFTPTIDDQFPIDLEVSYLALAGFGNLELGSFQLLTSGGPQEINLTGAFQPDFVLLVGSDGANLPDDYNDASLCIHAMTGTGSTQMATLGFSHRDNQTAPTLEGAGMCKTEDCVHLRRAGDDGRWSLSAFDADGFTLAYTTYPANAHYYFYLAIASGSGNYIDIGELTTRTDQTEQEVSSLGYKPAALMFFSHFDTENSGGGEDDHQRWSVGAATAVDERSVQSLYSEANVNPTDVQRGWRDDAVYLAMTDTPAVDGLLDVTLFTSTGFKWKMDTVDSAAHFVWWIAAGPVEAGSGPDEFVTVYIKPSP